MTIPARTGVMFAIFALFVCTTALIAQSAKDKLRLATEDDIREVVLRYQMEAWAKGGDDGEKEAKDETEKAIAAHLNFPVFYISIDDKDPSDAFLERFKNFPRAVKRASESEIDKQHRNAVVDKVTHRPGIVFRVEKIRWHGANSVEVEGGYFCDGLCASGEIFKLRRKQGKWIVTGSGMRWIS